MVQPCQGFWKADFFLEIGRMSDFEHVKLIFLLRSIIYHNINNNNIALRATSYIYGPKYANLYHMWTSNIDPIKIFHNTY